METTSKEVLAGQAVYSKLVLSIYDLWVLGISNSYIWKCPSRKILDHFNQHISNNHLDVGVGTGYFIDKCKLNQEARIALMDLNENSLNSAAARLKRFKPEKYRQNILAPVTEQIKSFDSVSLNYLFHCLPGDFSKKAVVFDNVHPLLNKGAVVFGSTILQGDIERSATARKLMKTYNRKGIFGNTHDRLEDLEAELSKRFSRYDIKTEGCVALFAAWAH